MSAARNIFDKNIVDKRDPVWVPLTTSVLADTVASQAENSLERPAMPAYARFHIVPHDEVGVYHCMARCVRRAFLCGVDPLTKHDCDYRTEWIRERLEVLASVFAIDICVADPARQVFVTSRLEPVDNFGPRVKGAVPTQLAPILERLGIVGDGWIETVRQFGRRFKTAVGRHDALAALAARMGKAWLQDSNAAALAFR